ncbi:hypothetical protein CC1G_11448 [Coprinopsis cinerea okayama7|uniref:Uncharacterized protein n=1 Tax=Coprinopsis cinerea (strain Okayama-7 / 130 / ATCC MYA-4618 / FGSC 9003) TaxID=240176 RepID=A8P021_COPC7|nr:hypothetical protein CC1G_11448 [Coprinopsis cinerea okayama7\|eukprot:XP_001837803.1 hypothetical protein CC1G_11448 [Coprinopsis cinerea okayama7\
MSNPLGAGKGDLSGIVNNLKGTIDNPGVPILQRQQAQQQLQSLIKANIDLGGILSTQEITHLLSPISGAVGDVAGTAGGLAGGLTGEQGAGGVLGGLTGGGGGGGGQQQQPQSGGGGILGGGDQGQKQGGQQGSGGGGGLLGGVGGILGGGSDSQSLPGSLLDVNVGPQKEPAPTADSQILKHYIGTLQNPNASQTAKNQAKKVLQDSGIDLSSV